MSCVPALVLEKWSHAVVELKNITYTQSSVHAKFLFCFLVFVFLGLFVCLLDCSFNEIQHFKSLCVMEALLKRGKVNFSVKSLKPISNVSYLEHLAAILPITCLKQLSWKLWGFFIGCFYSLELVTTTVAWLWWWMRNNNLCNATYGCYL